MGKKPTEIWLRKLTLSNRNHLVLCSVQCKNYYRVQRDGMQMCLSFVREVNIPIKTKMLFWYAPWLYIANVTPVIFKSYENTRMFCTSPITSTYWEASQAFLKRRKLRLHMVERFDKRLLGKVIKLPIGWQDFRPYIIVNILNKDVAKNKKKLFFRWCGEVTID